MQIKVRKPFLSSKNNPHKILLTEYVSKIIKKYENVEQNLEKIVRNEY